MKNSTSDGIKVVAGLGALATMVFISLAPTIGLIWLIVHFARKFW